MTTPAGNASRPPPSRMADTTRIVFRLAFLAVLVLAIGWGTGNLRQVPPDQAVVVRYFGRVARVRTAGLVVAWPSPIEDLTLLPAAGQQISLKMDPLSNPGPSSETDFQIKQPDDVVQLRRDKDAWNGQYFLTGDSSVVRLDATLSYSIADPAAYVLAEAHVVPALQRLFRAAAVGIAAGHDLDDFLVARPEQAAVAGNLGARREAVRQAFVIAINDRLRRLRQQGADLGVIARRLDIEVLLPPVAKTAFDNVLTASQIADQTAAAARTDAARVSQAAQRAADAVRSAAAAAAQEQIHAAAAQTADVAALHAQMTAQNRTMLLTQYFQDQIGALLGAAGAVIAVDPQGSQVILPGATP